MSITLTLESFVTGTKQSDLVDERALTEVIETATAAGQPFSTAAQLADALVGKKLITRWQAEKLLQGKYRGFRLGRYRLLELLGKGEMSSVYLAEHVRMKRRCAIKVLPAHKVRETSYLGRFHREAEAVAKLDHPNIVRAYDVDVEEEGGAEIHFLVMEYVVGRSLEKIVNESGPMSVVQAADSMRQAAAGVAHAHAAGLVHRDIKPGNLLVDEQGVVKLLDLGLARFFKDPDRESLTIKHDEKVLGTADYLAPEQAVDSHSVDERADIYALGCTLFFTLTARPPFVEGTLVQRLLAHQTQTPPAISEFRDDCHEDLTAIIRKMMAKEPEDRYQTAAEVEEALGGFLVDHGTDNWRKTHLDVIARVRGVDAVLNGPVQTPNVKSTASEAVRTAAADVEVNRGPAAAYAEKATSPAPSRDDQPAVQPASESTKRPAVARSLELNTPRPAATLADGVSKPRAAAESAKPVSAPASFFSSRASLWERIDKQLLAICVLLAVSIGFVVTVAMNASATDGQTEQGVENPDSTNLQGGNVGDVSPILNEPQSGREPAFGVDPNE